jgi:hypothetical protein
VAVLGELDITYQRRPLVSVNESFADVMAGRLHRHDDLFGAEQPGLGLVARGLSVALAMLAITLLANNTLQNLLEPLAFGRTLLLHPLVVLLVTTAGTLLLGVLGATLAAPVTAVTLRAIGLLGDAGLFAVATTTPAAAAEPPLSQDGHEASAGPTLAD